ncbi:hypothetical protein Rhal01_01528 [Rubritalea halochordaticola]|uniref:DUF4240 domain-containing protein n=1 Tax=Rubritalea halochordaticola TaxID=714537 RepID=A0ABP9UY11_9BACT
MALLLNCIRSGIPVPGSGKPCATKNRTVKLDAYLEQARPLSLTARAAISLHITEAYFLKKGLKHEIVDEFFDHLWQHPLQQEPKAFSEWEARRGDLVDFGLTDDLPDDLEGLLEPAGITVEELFHVVEAPVEILWGNFFRTADDETSLAYLKNSLVIAERNGIIFPTLSPYKESLFADNHGWGNPISQITRDEWRKSGSIGALGH